MRKLLPVAFVAACGGSSAQPDALIIVHPDAAIDAAINGAHDASQAVNTATIQTFGGVPALVAYRDGSGAWQMLTPAATYTMSFTDDYTFVMVCHDSTGFDAEWVGATAADSRQQTVFCSKNDGPTATVAASGHMAQAGTVQMFDTASSQTASWDFTLNVPTGAHDLVATDAGHIAIRRGVSIPGATTLPAINVVTEGQPLVATPLTITGRTLGDQLSTTFELGLTYDFAVLRGSSEMLMVPPASLLTAGDFQFLFFDVATANTDRSAQTQFSPDNTSFTLMPELTGVTFDDGGDALTAAWTTLPDHTEVQLIAVTQSSASAFSQQLLTVSPGWLAHHGDTHVGFDTSVPGYDAAWKIVRTSPYFRELQAQNAIGSVGYASGMFEEVNGAMVPTAPKHPRLRAGMLRR